jgi:hypothetical protein
MWQPVGNPGAVLSRPVEGKHGPQHLGHAANEGETLALEERLRTVMAIEPAQGRLVVEQFELTGRAAHMQIDDSLDLGGKLRRQHREGRRRIALEGQAA